MSAPVIIDVLVVVFLVAFALWGVKRGLLRAMAGLVILLVSLVGAGIFAGSFAQTVTDWVTPLVEQKVSAKVEEAITAKVGTSEWRDLLSQVDLEDLPVDEFLGRIGVDDAAWDSLLERIQTKVSDSGEAMTDAVTEAAAEALVYPVVYGVLFVVAFVLLLLLLHVLLGAMGLVMKLPGLSTLNALGGAAFGLVEGALLLFLAVWVGRHLGISFETELLAEAHILRIFTTHTPLSVLSFLNH